MDNKDNRSVRPERNPFHGLMEQMDAFFNESAKNFNTLVRRPINVRTYETQSNLIVEAELPGYKRDQIQLEIIGNQLRIAVEDFSSNEQEKNYRGQRAERTITIPFTISEKETKADLNNGILRITIPKKNSSRRFIDIND
ncbi:Hsp20/alpha crystallin family protein [Virgibacillus salexigens]|uniref:Hsp20/alpha crystallin family protein n=1 Tax=Virgibacillus massiliensis TaxID=1462526 RepID=A0A024QDA7_9BACI|nr:MULTISPECIES: Hsp20/alpha crystallin family protein [Virgibacillus]MYL42578.1 Hsp20 family protein [Virgibacillus massiliensis]CDQ40459.1 Hsp20/alpha crystallin family protein [Virgibacillus massiliensis]